jgi:hypothetical protein
MRNKKENKQKTRERKWKGKSVFSIKNTYKGKLKLYLDTRQNTRTTDPK